MLADLPTQTPPYYSWTLLFGIGLSAWFWIRLARRDDRLLTVYLCGLVSAFFGAKVLYLLAEGWHDWDQPDRIQRFLTGKSILGALLVGYAGVEWAKFQVGYRKTTGDWFATISPLGILIGRVGCLLHGCCLGMVCEHPAWWTLNDSLGNPRWPAVPLEIAFNLLAIMAFFVLRQQKVLIGQHFHLYLMSYGLFRFWHEFYRDTPRAFGPISAYQLAAMAVVALGLWGFQRRHRELIAVRAKLVSLIATSHR